MGWFDRSTGRTQVEALETVVGSSTSVEGAIRSDGGVRIDGALDGSVDVAGNVVIGEGARVVGDITARNLTVGGMLRGNVELAGQMQILSTGKVLGDVAVASLMIDDGGMFQGSSRLRGMDKAALPAPAEVAVTNHDTTIHVEPMAREDTIDGTARPSSTVHGDDSAVRAGVAPDRNAGTAGAKTAGFSHVTAKGEPTAAADETPTPDTRSKGASAKEPTSSRGATQRSSNESASAQDPPKEDPPKGAPPKEDTAKDASPTKGAPRTRARVTTPIEEPDLDLNFDGLDIEPVIPDVVIEDPPAKPTAEPTSSTRKGRRRRTR